MKNTTWAGLCVWACVARTEGRRACRQWLQHQRSPVKKKTILKKVDFFLLDFHYLKCQALLKMFIIITILFWWYWFGCASPSPIPTLGAGVQRGAGKPRSCDRGPGFGSRESRRS